METFKQTTEKLAADVFAPEELLAITRHHYLEVARDLLKPERESADKAIGEYALTCALQVQELIETVSDAWAAA